MRKSVLKSLATAGMVVLGSIGAHALEVGEQAPLFEAMSTRGPVRLADFLGKKRVVLAFHFADFTPV